jgi:uncharacterized protein
MQDEVEAFLGASKDLASPTTRVDTHAAIVFLSGERALKIKRDVKFPFLDFSTLERRKAACEAELAVNKSLAPAIYKRVVPITREHDGALKLDGAGEPVEWALEMARFDESSTLDKFAEAGKLTPNLAAAVADAIAAAHATAQIARSSGWTDSIRGIIRQNADAFRTADAFPAVARDELKRLSLQFHDRLASLFERRSKSGFVRRCHGDLHLANIALIDGKPVLFDAIEFDDRLATIDVMHDLAFTLMDLVHYGCDEAANIVFNRYLDTTPGENRAAVGLLPLSMSMRAAVRANVLMCRAGQLGSQKSTQIDGARAYFSLARSALTPPPPCIIAIGGLSGSGKTAAAQALAPSVGTLPGAVVLRSDVIRKRLLGVAELERLPPSAYNSGSNAEVYSALANEAAIIIGQGHSVVVDAVFARETERVAIESVAARNAVPFLGLFLTASLPLRQQRIGQRGADASDATTEVARMQETYDLGALTWTRIDASGTREATARLCRTLIPKASLRDRQDGYN